MNDEYSAPMLGKGADGSALMLTTGVGCVDVFKFTAIAIDDDKTRCSAKVLADRREESFVFQDG